MSILPPITSPLAAETLFISFFAAGTPKGQPRPRAFARQIGGRAVARVYDSGSAEGWKGAIAIRASEHLPSSPLEGPLAIDVEFYFPRPKCLSRKKDPAGRIRHAAKPDIDNAFKAVLDALVTIGFIRDDCQVCESVLAKFYVAKGAVSGARITVRGLEEKP